MPNPLQTLRELFHREPREQAEETSRLKQAVIILAALLVLGTVFVWLPRYQVRHTPGVHGDKVFDDEDAARKTLAQILGGAIVLLGLYFSAKTYGLSREGHITDRFTKAIEQLGKTDGAIPNIEVRLGAIYALERIALDSPRDHWTIMEVLTAYIRQNAPLDPDRPYTQGEKPRTDIQAILTVLGRRRTGLKRERHGQQLDLTKSRLCGADLREANLQKAILPGANLQKASLDEANLQEASLIDANLQEAYLMQSNLQKANLRKANLQEANLWNANLQEAVLGFANLQKANLESANLQAAILFQANLQQAYVINANLQQAFLDDADLQEAFGLTVDQVKSAQEWQYAHYSPGFCAKLNHPPETAEVID